MIEENKSPCFEGRLSKVQSLEPLVKRDLSSRERVRKETRNATSKEKTDQFGYRKDEAPILNSKDFPPQLASGYY